MSMNLKRAEKVWRETCPEESSGVMLRRRTPKRWITKIKASENREKLRRS